MAQQGSTGHGSKRSLEFWLVAVGSGAGVVAAIAAIAVFVVPTKDGRSGQVPGTVPTISTPSPSTSSAAAVSGGGAATATAQNSTETRYLTALSPTSGSGFLSVRGRDLNLSCPTNQSDDRYNEVTYSLPGTYAEFLAGMTVNGQADQDATAGLEVFIAHRQDRSDRQIELGPPVVLRQGSAADLNRALGDAVQLTLRITCTSPSQVILLTGPRITR